MKKTKKKKEVSTAWYKMGWGDEPKPEKLRFVTIKKKCSCLFNYCSKHSKNK